jgi:hypothetical protein
VGRTLLRIFELLLAIAVIGVGVGGGSVVLKHIEKEGIRPITWGAIPAVVLIVYAGIRLLSFHASGAIPAPEAVAELPVDKGSIIPV